MPGRSLQPEAFHGWYQIQESLSRLTGLEFALYGEDARPLGMISGESPFCRALKRSGQDGSFCERQCGEFIRDAARKTKVQFFTCSSGQRAFAIPIEDGASGGLVIAGGKTFSEKGDYVKAVEMLHGAGGRVALTGEHRYRFIGRRRLGEVLSLIKNTASQHFESHRQKYRYQLSHNRQMALLEKSAMLYRESAREEFIEGLLRSANNLFDAETASLLVISRESGRPEMHYIFGLREEAVTRAGESFEAMLAKRRDEPFRVEKEDAIEGYGLPREIRSLVGVPLIFGRTEAVLCLYNSPVEGEEMALLKSYARQFAAVIENMELKEEIERRVGAIRRLVAAGRGVGALTEQEDILRFVFEKSVELLEAERGSLMLMDEMTAELNVKLAKGLDEELRARLRLKAGEGIAGKVAAAGTPIMVSDLEADLAIKQRPEYKTKSFISLPLKVEGKVVGVINLADKVSGRVFNADDLEYLTGFASQASMALERAVFQGRVEDLRRSSITDGQTGLLNRRYFGDRLAEEIDRSKRYGHAFAVACIELSGLAGYAAEHGQKSGEEALKKAAAVVRSSLRKNDILARCAENAFTVIWPETDKRHAAGLAARIIRRIEAARFPAGESEEGRLAASAGVAGFPVDGEEPERLLEKAYQEMREKKGAGGEQ